MTTHHFLVQDLVDLIKPAMVKGDITRTFYRCNAIDNAFLGSLSFCTKKGEAGLNLIKNSSASVIICSYKFQNVTVKDKTLVLVKDPRLCFIRSVKAFCVKKKQRKIHPTAIIPANCQIGRDISIGPYVVMGEKVVIGKHVTIKAGAVIGSEGFGFQKNEGGIYERFPHLGGVIIGDDVSIGANTCIDQGTLGDTIIGKGTKIDNLVQVGHNCIIGKNCIIAAMALIGGKVEVEDGVWIAPHAVVVKAGVKVKSQALVGTGAIVLEDVEEKDVVVGVPSRVLRKRREDE